MRRRPSDVRKWLEQNPSLSQLSDAFPVEWQIVRRELADVLASRDFQVLKEYVEKASGTVTPHKGGDEALLSAQVRQHLARAAVRQMCVSAATGVTHGRVRFNLLNGFVAQRLLFVRDLERKPVSMFWFRLIWPLLWQRRFLMILVQPKGIYCFYSKKLVKALAGLIGDRSCVEIAAGDGTLSRFLVDEGVAVVATDDHSWKHTVRFPESVLREDARTALRKRKPQAVICSWPPAGNSFEQFVFKTTSVDLYIVISSRNEFGTGDWHTYRTQTEFDLERDDRLSRLVLPPELEGAVYVFRRKNAIEP